MHKIYAIVSLISTYVRLFLIPKIIGPITLPMSLMFNNASFPIDVFPLVGELLLYGMSFILVGVTIQRRPIGSIGVILYLFYYFLNSYVLSVMTVLHWGLFAFVFAFFVYSILVFTIIWIKNKMSGSY